MREQLLEMLIGQGIITEEEFADRVEKAKESNPLLQDREALAGLSLITLENDGMVADLLGVVFQSMDMMSEMVIMQQMVIEDLTARVEAVETN